MGTRPNLNKNSLLKLWAALLRWLGLAPKTTVQAQATAPATIEATTMATGYLLPIGTILQFFTDQGVVLSGGKIYTYTAGTTTPVATYTSSTLVTPNANPIILGSNGRLPASCWVGAGITVKMVLQDSSGNVISGGTIDNLQGINDFSSLTGANVGAALWPRTAAEIANSITPTNYAYAPGNVLRYGADPSGAANSSTAISNACLVSTTVYAPAGTYLCNVTVTNPVIFTGDGSDLTLLKPNSNTTAVITYNYQNFSSGFWAYPTEFRNLSFYNTGQLGIGFSFGSSSQGGYAAGMEYANNVKFYGVRFIGFNKGIQFPFGNIGTEFYSCGFVSNFYGAYLLNNKQYPSASGSTGMHAGNKYWFAGEFNNNSCAVYINNSQDGFGAVNFYGTIIENNNIGVYCYNLASYMTSVPISFNDVWVEANGVFQSASQVTIDSWSGSTVTTQNVNPHAFIFDGGSQNILFNGGFFTDTNVLASTTRVVSEGSRVESFNGAGGYPFLCSGSNSQIIINNPMTDRGVGYSQNTLVTGNFLPFHSSINFASTPGARGCLVPHRYTKLAGSYGLTSTVINLTSASNLANGSFPVTATTASDGIIYGTCNVWSIPFTAAGQIVSLTAAVGSLTAGKWYVMTCDLKCVSGNTVTVSAWDRSGNVIFTGGSFPTVGDWYTFAGMGYAPNAVGSWYGLDFTSTSTTTTVIRGSAYQLVTFDNQNDAINFLASNAYIGP